MADLLAEWRKDYRIYLTDGVPGIVIELVLLALTRDLWTPLVSAVLTIPATQQGQTTPTIADLVQKLQPILVAVGIVLVVLAPALGLVFNAIGGLLLDGLIAQVGHLVYKVDKVAGYDTDEAKGWLWLQEQVPDTWNYYDKLQASGILARTLSLGCLVAGAAAWRLYDVQGAPLWWLVGVSLFLFMLFLLVATWIRVGVHMDVILFHGAGIDIWPDTAPKTDGA